MKFYNSAKVQGFFTALQNGTLSEGQLKRIRESQLDANSLMYGKFFKKQMSSLGYSDVENLPPQLLGLHRAGELTAVGCFGIEYYYTEERVISPKGLHNAGEGFIGQDKNYSRRIEQLSRLPKVITPEAEAILADRGIINPETLKQNSPLYKNPPFKIGYIGVAAALYETERAEQATGLVDMVNRLLS